MGQDKIVIHVRQGELLPHAVFAFAQGRDPSPDRRHMLTEGEVVQGNILPLDESLPMGV
jgi:hypothetical protein